MARDAAGGVGDVEEGGQLWEKEFLAPILSSDPDAIRFTAYEELALGA
jgi:hypothetical protein